MISVRKTIWMPVLILAMAVTLVICGTVKANAEDDGMCVPLTVSSGFNVDAIFELDGDYSEGIDNTNDEWAYFALPGVTGSLPEDGLIKLGDKRYFKLGDYEARNVLKIDEERDSGKLTLFGNEKYKSLVFLMTGGNGGGPVDVTVEFSDGKSYKEQDLEVPDWYIGDESAAYKCGRYSKYTGGFDEEMGDSFGLFEYELELPKADQNKVVTGISFDNPGFDSEDNPTICIFGVSGVRNTTGKTVMFDSNGGTCDTTSVTGAPKKTIKLPKATKAGCAFLGWSDGTKTYTANTNYTISNDVVLTANWGEERNYIWLDPDDGYTPEYKHYINEDGSWPDPTRNGYRFTGYYSGDQKVESENLEPGDYYYAKWEDDPSKLARIDLWVQGVQVTKKNCNDILANDPKNKGKVKYDFETNTLTLNGADIYSVEGNDSFSGAILYDEGRLDEDLTVKLVGKNKIEDKTSAYYCQGICVREKSLTIEGTGSLEIEQDLQEHYYPDEARAIYVEYDLMVKSDIIINSAANCYSSGFYCAKLSITGSTVDITTRSNNSSADGFYLSDGTEFEKADIRIDATGHNYDSSGIWNESSTSNAEIKGSSLDIKCASDEGAAIGMYSNAELSIDGDSVVKTAGKTGLRALELKVAAGSTLEMTGTDRAMAGTEVSNETKMLGVKLKTNPEGEYSMWDGTADLNDESFKALYIPGNKVEHAKRSEPTCSKEGHTEYWSLTVGDTTTYYNSEILTGEHVIELADMVIPIDPSAHNYGVTYTWSKDNKTVTAKAVCEHNASHTEGETASAKSKTTKKATAKVKGEVTYTVTFKNPLFKTQTKKVATPKTFKTIKLNAKTVSAKAVANAIKKAGGAEKYITKVELGKKVKKISKKAFAKLKKSKTLVLKTKKLKKSSVKGCLKGSKISKVQVKVGSKKVNKKYIKKYKKIFTKKNAGKKVKVL